MRAFVFVAGWLLSLGCAAPAVGSRAPKGPHCQDAAPCPVQVAVSVESEVDTTICSVALGTESTGYVAVQRSSMGGPGSPVSRGQILEIDGRGQLRMHDDMLPGSFVRTDASGQPVVISRAWGIVLRHHGWLDGSYPHALGPWRRHVLDVDVRGVERLDLLDTRVGPGDEVFALLGSQQTTGQFALLLARTDHGGGWSVDTVTPSHLQGLAALDSTTDGRPFAAWSQRTTVVAGIFGDERRVVIDTSKHASAPVRALGVLAPTATEPALVSMLIGDKLLLARLGPGGPEIREVTEAKPIAETPEGSLELGFAHEDYITALPEHHILLRTDRDVRLAWLGEHVDRERQCDVVVSEVGPLEECRTAHDKSRSLLTVATIGDDLQPTELLTLVLLSTGARSLAGDTRGGAVALAVRRHEMPNRAEIDYVVLAE
jgi:hypothetical protein